MLAVFAFVNTDAFENRWISILHVHLVSIWNKCNCQCAFISQGTRGKIENNMSRNSSASFS